MLLQAKQPGEMSSIAEADEPRLISHVAAGDLHAFEILYRLYFPKLARFLDHLARRPCLIEEIINDTMLVVWQKAHTFNMTCKVSTWIFAIAYRKALKATRLLDDPVECDFEQYPDDAECGPEIMTRRRELRAMLLQALDALTIDQRTVVCLTYFHGLGYREIADIMECPLSTVKTRMFHARRRLETLLAGRMEEMW